MADIYRLYGLNVRSDLPLPGLPSEAPPYIELRLAAPGQPGPFEPDATSCLYRSPATGVNGQGVMEFHRHSPWRCLRCTDVADFFFHKHQEITCHALRHTAPTLAAALFCGPVCALLLELEGFVTLHACAVQSKQEAIAFLGGSGAGKSTLAADFMQRGHALVTDDVFAVKTDRHACWGVPGYPAVRLGRAASSRAAIEGREKPLVSVDQLKGRFASGPLPLRRLYLLDRVAAPDAGIRIQPLAAGERFRELLRWGFCARLADALDLQQVRFGALIQLCRQVVIHRLQYPHGLEHLGRVYEAVLQHEAGG